MKKLLVLLTGIVLFFVVRNNLIAMNGDRLVSIITELDTIRQLLEAFNKIEEDIWPDFWIQSERASLKAQKEKLLEQQRKLIAQEKEELDIRELIIVDTAGIEDPYLRQTIAIRIRKEAHLKREKAQLEADTRQIQENTRLFKKITAP